MLQDEEYAVELKQAEDAKTAMLLKPGNAAGKVNENNVTYRKNQQYCSPVLLYLKAPAHLVMANMQKAWSVPTSQTSTGCMEVQ